MRVPVTADPYAYPDIVVVCGVSEFLDQRQNTLLNPTMIVEVLSPSTEAYHRGLKFEMYQSLASLREYLLIASERVRVDRYIRQPSDEWLLTLHRPTSWRKPSTWNRSIAIFGCQTCTKRSNSPNLR